MLPATFQLPAAVVLVLGGVVACFAGYRLFRIVLSIYGFILGAMIATTVVGAGDTTELVVYAVIGGLVGALVLNLAYFLGVVLVGAALGAFVAAMVWARAGSEPHVLIVILFAVVGAVSAMLLQRYVVIVATAFGGAWTLLIGALALAGDRIPRGAAGASDVWVFYPLNPSPGSRWLTLAWLVLGVIGLAVQLRQARVRRRRTKAK